MRPQVQIACSDSKYIDLRAPIADLFELLLLKYAELTISRDFTIIRQQVFVGRFQKIFMVRDLCGTRRLACNLFYSWLSIQQTEVLHSIERNHYFSA